MMTMPKPQCAVCQCVMTFADDVIGGDTGYWFCKTHPLEMIMHEDSQAAYIATLEAERDALKAQVDELTQQVRDLEGWVDDPSGYYGGGGQEQYEAKYKQRMNNER